MVLVSKSNPRASGVNHKRRQGAHHKKNEHYLKPYWPYIPMVAIITVGLLCSSLWAHAQHGVLGYATQMSNSELLAGTNSNRATAGLGALALNGELSAAAQNKANDMATRDYWSHNTPDGKTPWTFIVAAGYNYKTAGENLAYGFDTSDDTITAWMNSPEHKANILNTTYTEVGFGFANADNYQGTGPETIVVAEYASPQAAYTPPPASTTPKSTASTRPAAQPQQAAEPQAQAATPTSTPASSTPPASANKESNTTAVASKAAPKAVGTHNVSRIQLITHGSAPWSMFAVSVIATVAILLVFVRHGLFWHRFLIKGERFVIHHHFFDFALVAVGVIAFILTRSAGVIR